jgi:hypothetical protein
LEHNWILVGLESSIDAGPTVVGIGLSFRFVKWISNRYDKTCVSPSLLYILRSHFHSPEVLRFFMGYIVDLTLIMEQLFLVALSFNPPRALTEADINLALEFYTTSDAAQVHRDIRRYANKATFAQILQSNRAEEKVEELIKQYCAQ